MKAIIVLIMTFSLVWVGDISAQTAVSIQGITNVRDDSVLAGGFTHTITLRYDFSGAPSGRKYLTSNGFRIYSPDGADWGSVQGAALGAFSGLGWDYVFVNHFHKTGGSGNFGTPQSSAAGNLSGQDTVVVLLAGVNAALDGGVPAGFNDQTLTITFQANSADAGLHICIDTCQQAPGSAWEWANADGLIEPTWSGKQCFVIGCCGGHVGDVNGQDGDVPTIGDISSLIAYLFLNDPQPSCIEECDVNLSGTIQYPPLDWTDITISDISYLIDFLFLSHPSLADCP
jgi:hypothetical protein